MTEYNLIRELLHRMEDVDATRLILESGKKPRFVIRGKTAIPVIGEPIFSRNELYLAAIDLMIKLEDGKTFTLMWGKGKQDPLSKTFSGQVKLVGDSIKIEFKYLRNPDRSRSVIHNNMIDLIDDMVAKDANRVAF